MKVIRAEGCNFETTMLGIEWGIRRCNIRGCTERELGAIIVGVEGAPAFGLCEKHFREGDVPGGVHMELDFAPLPKENYTP